MTSRNVKTANIGKLESVARDELSDVTLYLSHRNLHVRIREIFPESDDGRKKFDQVRKIFRSLAQAVTLLQVGCRFSTDSVFFIIFGRRGQEI
jgi:hypothetical protein